MKTHQKKIKQKINIYTLNMFDLKYYVDKIIFKLISKFILGIYKFQIIDYIKLFDYWLKSFINI